VLIWGAAGGLGVFATQLCAAAGATAWASSPRRRRASWSSASAPVDYIDRDEFAGMMRKGGETSEEEKARFKVSRGSPSASRRSSATPPTSSSSTSAKRRSRPRCCRQDVRQGRDLRRHDGIDLDFNVAYLWMRQKEILGSHFANAYECTKANELIEQRPDPPGAVAHARLRGRRRSAPADARKQASRQDLDPRRRRPRRAPARPPRDRERSTRRWVSDVRRSSHPVVCDGLPRPSSARPAASPVPAGPSSGRRP
jgi:hypothetical protein